jgi:hypothetical protein
MGAKSYPFLGVIGHELADLLPKSKTIVFPDTEHQMRLQRPEACRNDVEKFLAGYAKASQWRGVWQHPTVSRDNRIVGSTQNGRLGALREDRQTRN